MERKRTYLSNIFCLAILLTYLLQLYIDANYGSRTAILAFGKINLLINKGQWWRIFTCAFLHGNLTHLSLNLIGIYAFGRELELLIGNLKYFFILIVSILYSGIFSYAYTPNISIGASGAVFGIIGALALYYYLNKDLIVYGTERFKTFTTLIVINFVLGLAISKIDDFAHLGGLVGGILSYLLLP